MKHTDEISCYPWYLHVAIVICSNASRAANQLTQLLSKKCSKHVGSFPFAFFSVDYLATSYFWALAS